MSRYLEVDKSNANAIQHPLNSFIHEVQFA